MIVYQTKGGGNSWAGALNVLWDLPESWSSGFGYLGRMNEGLTVLKWVDRTKSGYCRWDRVSGIDVYRLLVQHRGRTFRGVTFDIWEVMAHESDPPIFQVAAYVGFANHVRPRRYAWRGRLPHELILTDPAGPRVWRPGSEVGEGVGRE